MTREVASYEFRRFLAPSELAILTLMDRPWARPAGHRPRPDALPPEGGGDPPLAPCGGSPSRGDRGAPARGVDVKPLRARAEKGPKGPFLAKKA